MGGACGPLAEAEECKHNKKTASLRERAEVTVKEATQPDASTEIAVFICAFGPTASRVTQRAQSTTTATRSCRTEQEGVL